MRGTDKNSGSLFNYVDIEDQRLDQRLVGAVGRLHLGRGHPCDGWQADALQPVNLPPN